MISAKSDAVSRIGSANDRMPAPARCMSRAITRRSVVSRDRNGRGNYHVAGGESLHQLGKLGPVGRGAGDLLAEHLFAAGGLELAHLSDFVFGGG